MEVALLTVRVDADTSGAERGLRQTESWLDRLGASFRRIGEFALGGVLRDALNWTWNKMQDLAGAAVDVIREAELLKQSFATMEARNIMRESGITDFNEALARATPLAKELYLWNEQLAIRSPFTEVATANLQRVGMVYADNTEEAKRWTQAIVDFSAGAGRTEASLNRFIQALGMVEAQGKLTFNQVRSFASLGINVWEILGDAFKVSPEQAMEMVKSGELSARQIIDSIITSVERDYQGAGERMAFSWAGLLSTLSDLHRVVLERLFGPSLQRIRPYIQTFIEQVTEPSNLQRMQNWGNRLADTVQSIVDRVGSAVDAARTGGVSGLLENLGLDPGTADRAERFITYLTSLPGRIRQAMSGLRELQADGASTGYQAGYVLNVLGLDPGVADRVHRATEGITVSVRTGWATLQNVVRQFQVQGVTGGAQDLAARLGFHPEVVRLVGNVVGDIVTAVNWFRARINDLSTWLRSGGGSGVTSWAREAVDWLGDKLPGALKFVNDHWSYFRAILLGVAGLLLGGPIMAGIRGLVAALPALSTQVQFAVGIFGRWLFELGRTVVMSVFVHWVKERIPDAIRVAMDWKNRLITVLGNLGTWFNNTRERVSALVGEWRDRLNPTISTVIEWKNRLMTTIRSTMNFLNELRLLVGAVTRVFIEFVDLGLDVLVGFLKLAFKGAMELAQRLFNIVRDAAKELWDVISPYVLPVIRDLTDAIKLGLTLALDGAKRAFDLVLVGAREVADFWRDVLDGVIRGIADLIERVGRGFDGAAGAIRDVRNWLDRLADSIRNLPGLPDWVARSPSRMEQGFRGAAAGVREFMTEYGRMAYQSNATRFMVPQGGGLNPAPATAGSPAPVTVGSNVSRVGSVQVVVPGLVVRSEQDIGTLAFEVARHIDQMQRARG